MTFAQFMTEFGYWIYTTKGEYYRRMLVNGWLLFFYLLIIAGDVVYVYRGGNNDFLIVVLLFVWMSYGRIKKMMIIKKEYREFLLSTLKEVLK